MAKVRTVFICQACGFESSKWLGRCPDCGEWNSLVEERQEVAAPPGRGRPAQMALPGGGSRPVAFDDVDAGEADRVPSGIGEFDRVLGGGIVPGSMVLIGGEPGIGKSTLLLEVAHLLGRTHGSVLYVSGEESERQIRLRGDRLGISGGGLFLMAETSLERILEEVESLKPAALVVDSVQTVYSSRFPSSGIGPCLRRRAAFCMPARGLLTSWAMPLASCPVAARRWATTRLLSAAFACWRASSTRSSRCCRNVPSSIIVALNVSTSVSISSSRPARGTGRE